MVTRIKKIISFLEKRKQKVEEQIRVKNETLKLLQRKKEKLITEITNFRKGFFTKIKTEKKAVVNYELRENIGFCKSRIIEIESSSKEIESEIALLKMELVNLVQRLRALEKFEEKLQREWKTTVARKWEKEIRDLIMVKYCGR